MTSKIQPDAQASNRNATGAYRSDIVKQWGKFTATEIAGLKDRDDLIAQVQSKYGLDKAQAQKDVDAFANGRQL